jgi:monofunctional biosynthetic peptidoglycan transglycosylase
MRIFIVLPLIFLGASIVMHRNASAGATSVPKEKIIIDFGDPGSVERWRIVNDGVMGGLSNSLIRATPNGNAVFEGRLSLENNGGFASVRTLLNRLDLSDQEGISLRVRGDGRTYQVRFRTNRRFDGVTYRATFTTKRDRWTTVRVPFSEFIPTYRGRILRGVEPLDTTDLQQLAFMVADKKEGRFQLEIDWVRAYASIGPKK